ncbi:hypothetical protein LINPERPRIM_LOCUS34580 [Linum perenne]
MDQHLKLGRDIRNHHQPLSTSYTSPVSPADQNPPHLTEGSKQEKHLSYADLHRHITGEIPSKACGNVVEKQHKKVSEEDELVKYMSKVPSYLEKGRAQEEKVLNFGVLDWNRLQMWQDSQHNRRVSVSNDKLCSLMASEGLSGGPSCSPSRQRTRRPSMQFHSSSSSAAVTRHTQLLEHRAERSTYARTGKAVTDDPLGIKFDEWKRKVEERKMASASNNEAQFAAKEMKTVDQRNMRRPEKRPEKMQERKVNVIDRETCQKNEPVVLLLPTDAAVHGSHNGIPRCPNPTTISSQRSTEVQKPREVHYTVVSSTVPHSCPLPRESEREVETRKFSKEAENVCSLSRPGQHQAEISNVPSSHCRTVDAKGFTAPQRNPALKPNKVTPDKVRSTSPFRRLSMGIGKNSMALGQETSTSDQRNATSRGRSRASPLRRLLDPLLKPKVKDLPSVDMCCTSSQRKMCSSSGISQPGKVSSEEMNRRPTIVEDLHTKKKSTSLQGLLRVAFKNGQPLYTFAVDNESDILAATMKKLTSSNNNEYSCIYTFFSIQESKKKNGGSWINQGGKGKGKGQEIRSNVVAQLKVSGTQFSREYVLFSVDMQHQHQQILGYEPNDELAAIVQKGFTSASSLISTTAILPSGVHSVPAKGGPSSLLQRWRSGGSCDCGGWDLGCNLQILSNPNQLHRKPASSEPRSTADAFQLIPQGGEGENQSMFSLAPFKDGIQSVEFHSSLSTLQAFSLCIAAVDSKNLVEAREPHIVLDATPEARIGKDVPARYVSYPPPLSPAGRV